MNIKDYLFYYKNKFLTFIILIAIALAGFFVYKYYTKEMKKSEKIEKKISVKEEIKKEENKDVPKEKQEKYDLVVDVKGEVVNPGVYKGTKEERVIDMINKAGGFKNNADTSLINLSAKLRDSMVITVFSKEEVMIQKKENMKELCKPFKENNACPKVERTLSINKASLEELSNTFIGEKKAKLIIERREVKPFESLDELKDINGIGDKTLVKIKENFTL